MDAARILGQNSHGWCEFLVGQDSSLGSEALGAVTGHGLAMIEMAMLGRVELDQPVIIRSRDNSAIWGDGFDHDKVAVPAGERRSIPPNEVTGMDAILDKDQEC
jgi:hypothetical protein